MLFVPPSFRASIAMVTALSAKEVSAELLELLANFWAPVQLSSYFSEGSGE